MYRRLTGLVNLCAGYDMSKATIGQIFSLPLLVSVITTVSCFAAYFPIATGIWRQRRGDAAVSAWACSYVNAGNLGLPIAAYALGDTAVVSALIVFQCVAFIHSDWPSSTPTATSTPAVLPSCSRTATCHAGATPRQPIELRR